MKRSLFAATAASALILVAGCSKQDNENQAAATNATAEPTTPANVTAPSSADREELLQDAVAALQETENALAALDKKDGKAATAALERATGKLEIVLARNPSLALAPVDVSVVTYDVLGSVDAVIRRHASAVVAPCASTTSASRSLPIISSGRCFLLGIPCLLRNPKYHQFWTTQKGADQ